MVTNKPFLALEYSTWWNSFVYICIIEKSSICREKQKRTRNITAWRSFPIVSRKLGGAQLSFKKLQDSFQSSRKTDCICIALVHYSESFLRIRIIQYVHYIYLTISLFVFYSFSPFSLFFKNFSISLSILLYQIIIIIIIAIIIIIINANIQVLQVHGFFLL